MNNIFFSPPTIHYFLSVGTIELRLLFPKTSTCLIFQLIEKLSNPVSSFVAQNILLLKLLIKLLFLTKYCYPTKDKGNNNRVLSQRKTIFNSLIIYFFEKYEKSGKKIDLSFNSITKLCLETFFKFLRYGHVLYAHILTDNLEP